MVKFLRLGTLFFVLIALLCSGCMATAPAIQENSGLVVGSLSTSLGSANDNSLDETLFSYEIQLTNSRKAKSSSVLPKLSSMKTLKTE